MSTSLGGLFQWPSPVLVKKLFLTSSQTLQWPISLPFPRVLSVSPESRAEQTRGPHVLLIHLTLQSLHHFEALLWTLSTNLLSFC